MRAPLPSLLSASWGHGLQGLLCAPNTSQGTAKTPSLGAREPPPLASPTGPVQSLSSLGRWWERTVVVGEEQYPPSDISHGGHGCATCILRAPGPRGTHCQAGGAEAGAVQTQGHPV